MENKLGIEVGDLVTWGGGNHEVSELLEDGFLIKRDDYIYQYNHESLRIFQKVNKSLEEKYEIKLINKEMWCWDDDPTFAELCFVILKKECNYPYMTLNCLKKNASLEKPVKTMRYTGNELFDGHTYYTKEEMLNIINELK